jgi:hypothetical protein
MAALSTLLGCAASAEDLMERQFCLGRLSSILQVMMEVKLWRILQTLRELPMPTRPLEEGIKGLKEESEWLFEVLSVIEALKDPTPEPIVFNRAAKLIQRFLKEELTGMREILRRKEFMEKRRC